MNKTANKSKKWFVVLAIGLILLVATNPTLANYLQLNLGSNANAVISQTPKRISTPTSISGNNSTSGQHPADFLSNSSTSNSTVPTYPGNMYVEKYAYSRYSVFPPNLSPFEAVSEISDQGQPSDSVLPANSTDASGTNILNETNSSANNSSTQFIPESIFLENSNFTTYTYGGYPVEQADDKQFYFIFPDATNSGELAGSDAISLNCYLIQNIIFDATFIAPKISAFGFDEMAIFAASDTVTYKGTEFGIRMDLQIGSIYGYIQEPNGIDGDVNFQMIELKPNDEQNHHYSLIATGSEVMFFIDGGDFGHLNFPSNIDCSNFNFSICAVIHRFTDVWDSDGNNMTVGNFSVN